MKTLRKDDKVVVLTGKDKGKQGEIMAFDFKHNKVKVKGINIITCHIKPKRQGEAGGIQKREAFIDISNVLPVDSLTGLPVRLSKLNRK
ncbi:50S ribosomal protein L24 [Candidatus Babeliales bacterium]|nr:50S ribosomal protein L24 [Candidatus Babeliales bacterium]MBP9843589.1 50S ribosomal protein L24 [Candidatus Babeliales bacterium]